MDWKRLDRARREVGPVHLDLIEHYAQGKISRRSFIRRGTIIGLSMPLIGAVISACGGDDDDGGESGGTGTTTGGAPGTSGAPGTTGAGQAGGMIRIAYQTPAGPLDPINMVDLASYGLVAQCFEFLCTLGDDGELAPGLAESWEPNEDGTVWTFQLRQGVKWQDGGDFTSADVAATMDRLAEAENAGLLGVIADRMPSTPPIPNVAVFNLEQANGNLPYLVSVFNAQTPITPVDYEIGTTLDASPNGTGPWKLGTFDPATGATFERNPDWWGGETPLDGQEVTFFGELGTMVTAVQGGAADAIIQFSVLGGDALLNDPNFNVLEVESSTHRQIWMGCTTGQFVEQAVRQALAFTFDREQMISTLFQGRAVIGNDHVIAPFMPFFNEGAVEQRTKDVERARELLTEAGVEGGFQAVLHAVDLQEIPQLAQLIQAGRRRGRHPARDRRRERRDVLRHAVVPARATRRAPGRPSLASSTTATGRCPTCSSTRRSRRAACGTRRSTPTLRSTRRSPLTRRRSASRSRPKRLARSSRSSTRTCRSGCRSSTTSFPATRTPSRESAVRRSARCSWTRRPGCDV